MSGVARLSWLVVRYVIPCRKLTGLADVWCLIVPGLVIACLHTNCYIQGSTVKTNLALNFKTWVQQRVPLIAGSTAISSTGQLLNRSVGETWTTIYALNDRLTGAKLGELRGFCVALDSPGYEALRTRKIPLT